jgi:hypothetical protein
VEYLVRAARVTDIDRLVALSDATIDAAHLSGPLGAADLLRQLVYLPQASIFVAEAQRNVVGGAVLALRPSVVAGGYVGTIDLLVVDPDHDADRVTAALLEELVRRHDGGRILWVSHSACQFALQHLLAGRDLSEVVAARMEWQPGWEYLVPSSWTAPSAP